MRHHNHNQEDQLRDQKSCKLEPNLYEEDLGKRKVEECGKMKRKGLKSWLNTIEKDYVSCQVPLPKENITEKLARDDVGRKLTTNLEGNYLDDP